jgi:hypothetical protein
MAEPLIPKTIQVELTTTEAREPRGLGWPVANEDVSEATKDAIRRASSREQHNG